MLDATESLLLLIEETAARLHDGEELPTWFATLCDEYYVELIWTPDGFCEARYIDDV